MINLVYYGTGQFSASILRDISKDNNLSIKAVITQSDKKIGRAHVISSSPVKQTAESLGLKVYQPETLKNFSEIELNNADLALVAEYGLIIPERLIILPKFGTVNLHTSLLPKYRGASPIQSAIINGENKTGVTLMIVDKKMDHGPIICSETAEIEPNETQKDIFEKLAKIASRLFLEKTPLWMNGQIKPIEQDHELATYTKLISREDGLVDFSKTAIEIYNLWRGLTPWPGVWTDYRGERLKFNRLIIAQRTNLKPGEVCFDSGHFYIGAANDSSVEILEIQRQGKKNAQANDFINGHKNMHGQIIKNK